MNHLPLISRMRATVQAIRSLAEGLSPEQARWRPDESAWSVLEVVNHLLDEEREDFRVRLDILLHRPAEPWPPIDPQGWVASRDYQARDLAESLADFLQERERSLVWLQGLQAPDFHSFVDSRFGRMSAGDMLASWAAHDLLHIRQLAELRYGYQRVNLAPFSPDYAGDF